MQQEQKQIADGKSAEAPTQRADRLRELVETYQRRLLAYALRLCEGDRERARDAVQETLLRLCQADPCKLDGREAAWLFRVCRTRVIDMQRTKLPSVDGQAAAATMAKEPSAEAVAAGKDEHRAMLRLIDDLAPRQQEVLRLRLQGGLSYEEIAEVTGLQRSAVGYHLHQAIRNLRSALGVTQRVANEI